MINDMDKQFNFEQVGKRMPYNVPDGFFDQLEQNVIAEVMPDDTVTEKSKVRARTVKMAIHTILAAAAAVALFFVVTKNLPSDDTQADTFEFVELAYNNLSTEDQEFLMEVYEEDEFINDNNEEDYDEDI
jgi:hypothetical protein